MELLIAPPPNLKNSGPPPRAPPKTLLSVASCLEENGISSRTVDGFLQPEKLYGLLERIDEIDPETVYISPFDYNRFVPRKVIYRIAREIRSKCQADIGFLWSYERDFLEEILKNSEHLDFGVYGDPEPVVKEISGGKNFEDVEGVVHRKNDQMISTGKKLLEDLDRLPFLDWDLIPRDDYRVMPHRYKNRPSFEVMASRGCPFNCKFCFNEFFPRKRRTRSPENVVREIRKLKEIYGAEDIRFDDPIFGLNHDWLKKFCNLMIEEDIEVTWSCQKRVNEIDRDTLVLMKDAGCWNILYGVESANESSLQRVNKKINPEQTKRTVEKTKQAGIQVTASFILGLPDEGPEESLKTIEFAKELSPEYAQFFLCRVYSDRKYFENFGEIEGWKLTDYDFRGPIFVPKKYENINELEGVKKRAYIDFYLRKDYLFKMLEKMSIDDFRRFIHGIKILSKI